MSANESEIELKFTCESSDIAAVMAAAPAGEDTTRRLISTYFDTPDHTLRKAGASLRLRTDGVRRVQTFKRGGGFSRKEHEGPVEGEVPDLSRGPLADLLPRGRRAEVAATFAVDLIRRERQLSHAGARIEMALDQGEVRAGGAGHAICEVELELKAGPAEALFALARDMAHAAPLYLSFETKSAWGYALLDGVADAPRKAGPGEVASGATAAAAFQSIARAALSGIASNAALLRGAPSAEAVHQLRVSARRFRAALSNFKPLVADDRLPWVKEELKWLTEACGPARALDVLSDEIVAPALSAEPEARGLADLAAAVVAAGQRAHGRSAAAVSSARFRALVLEACAWIELGAWRSNPQSAGPAGDFAPGALRRRRRKLLDAARDFAGLDDAGRHHARIQAKILRYGAEAFAGLDEDGARRFIRALKRVQAHLGGLNDLAGLPGLLGGLALEGPALYAAGRLEGRLLADKPARLVQAERALQAFAGKPSFWDR
jgi:inorganic triphosphatase YgiF